jgi:hypothetical protein
MTSGFEGVLPNRIAEKLYVLRDGAQDPGPTVATAQAGPVPGPTESRP